MTFIDTWGNRYDTLKREKCAVGGKGIYMENKSKTATTTAAAGSVTAFNVDSEATLIDMASTYTWDGSYTDPTTCDNETQIRLTDEEFEAQENRCILNGLLCSWNSSTGNEGTTY